MSKKYWKMNPLIFISFNGFNLPFTVNFKKQRQKLMKIGRSINCKQELYYQSMNKIECQKSEDHHTALHFVLTGHTWI